MEFEKTEVWGFEHAIRGMRNPMNSWGKTDSIFRYAIPKNPYAEESEAEFVDCIRLGENDLNLMRGLIKAGSEHRKFMRQIFVSVDITASLYWWKEFDTYKVGTVSNSCSTMHKLASTPITLDCFETDDLCKEVLPFDVEVFIQSLEEMRQKFNETKDKRIWKELIRWLPESWLQKRTITMNYENVLSMVHQRKNHKLTEWSVQFMAWVRTLPYADELFEV
jgi:Fe-S cluster biosynthesis and repair protein YggX